MVLITPIIIIRGGEVEYLLVGDSFAHGNCVNENDTIARNIKKLSKKVLINIGYAGSGPLL